MEELERRKKERGYPAKKEVLDKTKLKAGSQSNLHVL
jgi:hypothetical protein